MKSLAALPLLLLTATAVAKPSYTVGVGGGVLVTDPLEVLGSGPNIVPRAGMFFNDSLGLELEAGIASGTTRIGEFPHTTVTPRISLLGKLWNKGRKLDDGTVGDPPFIHPTVGAGFGFWYKSTNDPEMDLGSQYQYNDVDFLASAGPGLMVPLGILHLRTDLRWTLSLGSENYRNRGDQFINWEWTAGIGLTFGGDKDKDKDGIVDAEDACPAEAEDVDRFEDDDGCPDEDNDGDGILDADDTQCPNEPEDEDDFEDDDGCPDPDNDNDEILDEDDMCPLEPGNESGKGCPDEDEDTVVDTEDECVDEPGTVEAFGCPDQDEDRVPDWRDECPEEAAPKRANPKLSNGCPVRVFITANAITITDKVFFDTGKATIKKESKKLLDEVAETLLKNEFIKKVSIEGHTDNTGDKDKNQKLSEDRAASVVAYLVEDGVEEERLTSKGFGQTKPLVDGEEADTDEGRAKNRRVEFNIVEQEEQKIMLSRPKLSLGDVEDDSMEALQDMDGLTVKTAKLPEEDLVKGEHTCTAKIAVQADGTVGKVRVSECIGLARYATRGTLKSWTFEPYEVDGEAKRIATELKVEFKEGQMAVEHDKSKLKVLDDE